MPDTYRITADRRGQLRRRCRPLPDGLVDGERAYPHHVQPRTAAQPNSFRASRAATAVIALAVERRRYPSWIPMLAPTVADVPSWTDRAAWSPVPGRPDSRAVGPATLLGSIATEGRRQYRTQSIGTATDHTEPDANESQDAILRAVHVR